jgi:FixJ family two-component response regulator
MKSGASGYITKPYQHDVLKRRLSEAVKNKALANGHDAAKGILEGFSISIIIWSFIVSGIVSIFSI